MVVRFCRWARQTGVCHRLACAHKRASLQGGRTYSGGLRVPGKGYLTRPRADLSASKSDHIQVYMETHGCLADLLCAPAFLFLTMTTTVDKQGLGHHNLKLSLCSTLGISLIHDVAEAMPGARGNWGGCMGSHQFVKYPQVVLTSDGDR